MTVVTNLSIADIQDALTQQLQSVSSALRIGLPITVSGMERYGRYTLGTCNLYNVTNILTKLCLILQMDVKQLRMILLIPIFHQSHWVGLSPTLVPFILSLVPVWITLVGVVASPLWPGHVGEISFLKPGGNLWTTVTVALQTSLSSCVKLNWYVLYAPNMGKWKYIVQICMFELLYACIVCLQSFFFFFFFFLQKYDREWHVRFIGM